MKTILLQLIGFYQKNISFIFSLINPNHGCRFYPSCSEYSYQAIKKYGPVKGLALAIKRILKCNPFSGGGIDLC